MLISWLQFLWYVNNINDEIEVIICKTLLFWFTLQGNLPYGVQFLLFAQKEYAVTSILEFLGLLMTVNFCFLSFCQGR